MTSAPVTSSRRALLLALAALPLAACRVRLEDDAPHVPLVPTREPVPDEQALVALVVRLRALATDAAARPAVAAAHRRQADVVEHLLRRDGVPSAPFSASSSASSSASASPTPSAPLAPAALGTREALTIADLTALGALTSPHAAQVRSIAAYRTVVAASLGARTPWPTAPIPASTPAATSSAATSSAVTSSAAAPGPDDVAVGLLAAFRAAAYALDVAAARSGTLDQVQAAPKPAATQRALLLADAEWAATRARRLVERLGTAAPAPPVGYPPPFPVSTAAAARRLAAQSFSTLERSIGALLVGPDPASLAVHALAETLQHGARWGLALRPFPGLVEPTRALTSPTASATTSPTARPTS